MLVYGLLVGIDLQIVGFEVRLVLVSNGIHVERFVEALLRKRTDGCCLCCAMDHDGRFWLMVIDVVVTLSGVDVVASVWVKFQGRNFLRGGDL